MAFQFKFIKLIEFLLAFFSLVLILGIVISGAAVHEYGECCGIVERWADASLQDLQEMSQHEKDKLKDVLFFLHVPRTGGRSFFHCLLRNLYPSEEECPRSYDKVRFDMSKPKCRLISTHDDYSIVSKLPKDRTSIVTVLRNPIDRVFSAYEFSVEVASRFLIHPNLSAAMRSRQLVDKKLHGVSTLDIWPWKYLVPWMREDLFARREARRLVGIGVPRKDTNPYNMTTMLMPLYEFIQHPLANELVHNGITFQVTGLNNNSHLEGAWKIRQCVSRYPLLGSSVLQVAKRRLDEMLFVGLTEDHKESAVMFANLFGTQVMSQSQNSTSTRDEHNYVAKNRTGNNHSSLGDSEEDIKAESIVNGNKSNRSQSNPSVLHRKQNVGIDKLLDSYEGCVSTSRSSQGKRRVSSLRGIAPANFSKEARSHVPESVKREIEKYNALDMELYEHAKKIYFTHQRAWFQQQKVFQKMLTSPEMNKVSSSHFLRFPACNCFWVFVIIAPAFALIYILITRSRTIKVKI